LHIEVTPVPYQELRKAENAENSIQIAKRVELARAIQLKRFQNEPGIYTNAQMNEALLKKWGLLSPGAEKLLELAMEKFQFSARAYDRIRKLSRTIADLEGISSIKEEHISEAIQYRNLDRSTWGQFKS
jgi:magnesium chelatase family protein